LGHHFALLCISSLFVVAATGAELKTNQSSVPMEKYAGCLMTLRKAGHLSFPAFRKDTVVIRGFSGGKEGLFILKDGKSFFANVPDSAFKSKRDIPSGVVEGLAASLEIKLNSAGEKKPLQILASNYSGRFKTLQIQSVEGKTHADRFMTEDFQKQSKEIITAQPVQISEFEQAFALQMRAHFVQTGQTLRDELATLAFEDEFDAGQAKQTKAKKMQVELQWKEQRKKSAIKQQAVLKDAAFSCQAVLDKSQESSFKKEMQYWDGTIGRALSSFENAMTEAKERYFRGNHSATQSVPAPSGSGGAP